MHIYMDIYIFTYLYIYIFIDYVLGIYCGEPGVTPDKGAVGERSRHLDAAVHAGPYGRKSLGTYGDRIDGQVSLAILRGSRVTEPIF